MKILRIEYGLDPLASKSNPLLDQLNYQASMSIDQQPSWQNKLFSHPSRSLVGRTGLIVHGVQTMLQLALIVIGNIQISGA